MKTVKIRIGNLKFGEATYVGNAPEHPVYLIDVIEKNQDYFDFKRGYFVEDKEQPEHYRYNGPDEKRKEWTCLYDKSCFVNEEVSWAIAAFHYNEKNNCYELDFFRWNEFLDEKYKEHREDFWRLLKAIDEFGIFESPIKED